MRSTYIRIPMHATGIDGMAQDVEDQLSYAVLRSLETAGLNDYTRSRARNQIRTLREFRKRMYSAALKASGHKLPWMPIVPIKSASFQRYLEGKLRTSLN